MKSGIVFSSASVEWGTPQGLFNELNSFFNFTLDVCASDKNAKCEKYFTKENDGLKQSWAGHRCWMNPPYGSEIALWVEKAAKESAYSEYKAAAVIILVPARTDTQWFHKYVVGNPIRFLEGRLKFTGGNGSNNSATFPSMLVQFGHFGRYKTLGDIPLKPARYYNSAA